MSDFRFAARMLAKAPGFTLLSIALLTLGIGSSAVLFSALNAVLLRPLPVEHPEQLVRAVQMRPKAGTSASFPYAYYRSLRKHSTTLSSVFGEAQSDAVLSAPGPAETVQVNFPTPDYFAALGVRAQYGRTLTADDANGSAGTPPAVLSYGFWRRRFGGDVRALGQTIVLHGHAFVIVGILPREFNGFSVDTAPDLRVPVRVFPLLSPHPSMPLDVVQMELAGRLKPGVTRDQAQFECLALWKAWAPEYFAYSPTVLKYQLGRGVLLEPLENGVSILRERYGAALKALFLLISILLAMVCANLAGLLLARGATRQQEIAVRLALGAGPIQILRQMLIEPMLLTAIGALGGLLLAFSVAPLFTRVLPPIRDLATRHLILSVDLRPDHRVLLFSVVLSLITGVFFGSAPAISASRVGLEGLLRRGRAGTRARGRMALVAGEVALCTLLLGGAGLLVRTFTKLSQVDPGFDTDHVATFTFDPALSGYTGQGARVLLKTLSERINALPGVAASGFASRGVMRVRGLGTTVALAGDRSDEAGVVNASLNSVSPEYFRALGISIISGRSFTDADELKSKPAKAIVNEAFVRRFLSGGDPLGKRFGAVLGGEVAAPDYEVVGVVGNAKYRSLREIIPPTFYSPFDPQFNGSSLVLYVRTYAKPDLIIRPVSRILARLDPAMSFREVETLREEVRASMAGERLTASLASAFGGLASVLTAVCIYGLLAYVVTQKRREIGIRIALGARSSQIGLWIGGESLASVAVGTAIGLGSLLGLAPLIAPLLYATPPRDSISMLAPAVLVVLLSVAVTAIPSLRATRVDPSVALRQD